MNDKFIPFLIVFFIAIIGFFVVRGFLTPSSSTVAADQSVSVEKPNATMTINKVMYFPLKDDQGNDVSKLKYEILSAELRKQIIVKGQKATAVDGRTFLIVNLKINNEYEKPIQLRTRDYVRLIVNGSKEKLAPEIHNDPVEVQAISTKYTRLGFPINDKDQNLVLQIGEVGGKKEEIKLNLR